MQVAVNYSPQAVQLLQAGRIMADRLKCPDWPQQIADAGLAKPVYVHFPLEAHRIDDNALVVAIELADRTDTPYVNLHLSPRHTDFRDDDAVRAAVRRGVQAACRIASPGRVIVENIPLGNPAEGFSAAATEPAFVADLVAETGCGLLLDLSHARLAATHLRQDWQAIVESMPVASLRELHLTGIAEVDGVLRDHMAFSADDLTAAAWAVDQIAAGRWAAPWVVAVEYGGVGPPFAWRSDQAVLAADLPRVRAMVDAANRALAGV